MSQQFWSVGPLQHQPYEGCVGRIQPQHRTLQNTYKEVFITLPKLCESEMDEK